ncbi:MAG: hypothetical protein H6625_03780 [Bdellovibrionaceae bacterium]|nr:hypothetical protein [Pseudobdellovibrionaceae bacterium]
MKKACIVTQGYYNQNRLFDLSDKKINRDNCLYSFFILKKKFAENNIDLVTSDICPPHKCEYILFNEMPKKLPPNHDPNKSFLLLFETELIRPINWDLKRHIHFKKIFTWADDYVDHIKYIKINFSHLFPEKIKTVGFANKKFCTLIAGNKRVKHPYELYSERLKTIKWFERYHSYNFEYYGMGWEDYILGNSYLNKIIKKLNISKYIPNKTSRCYCGSVEIKSEILKNYKFAICYENARNISGYITEKIFDCFFSGCIPIYFGAPNIEQYVDKKCFIDRRDFKNLNDLYLYLQSISEREYNKKHQNIQNYIQSEASKQFRSNYFADTIVKYVTEKK